MRYNAMLPTEICEEHPTGIIAVEVFGYSLKEVAARVVEAWFIHRSKIRSKTFNGLTDPFDHPIIQAIEIADRDFDHSPRAILVGSNEKYTHLSDSLRKEWYAYRRSSSHGGWRPLCHVRMRSLVGNIGVGYTEKVVANYSTDVSGEWIELTHPVIKEPKRLKA